MKTTRIATLGLTLCLLLAPACDQSGDLDGYGVGYVFDTSSTPQDTGGGTTPNPGTDTGIVDSGQTGEDTAPADVAPATDATADTLADGVQADAESGADVGADAAAETVGGCEYVCNMDCTCKVGFDGCDLPECETDECVGLISDAEAAVETAAAGCTSALACRLWGYPICGTVGCFQGAVRDDADLTDLNNAAHAAETAGCSRFTCGCNYPTGQPLCLDDACRMCPPDCGTSCTDLEAAIDAVAAQNATGCTVDADCTLTPVNVCNLGGHILCGAYAHRVSNSATPVTQLVAEYLDEGLACTTKDCDCTAAAVVCDAGRCIPVE